MRAPLLFTASALLLGAGPAPAPLPADWSLDPESGSDAPLQGIVEGLYGHGFAEPIETQGSCQGDEAAREALVSRAPYRVEFWLYATAGQGVLFVRAADLDSTKPCAQAVTYSYEMKRAFVADGLVHSFNVSDQGDLADGGTRRSSANDREYSGSFDLLHNLMSRAPLPKTKRHSKRVVAGLPAHCADSPGLVWSSVCRFDAAGLAHGMIAYASAGDDEREMFHLEFDRIAPRSTLDVRLFDVGRSWRHRDSQSAAGAAERQLTSQRGGD